MLSCLDEAEMLCIAHRGASGHEPENTLRSIQRALEIGARFIEIDVHFVDGEILVIHDHRLNRTTDGTGVLAEKTFSYIRSLNAGKGERIPTLKEVLDLVARRAVINVELKGASTAIPVVSLIETYIDMFKWTYSDFLISSFDHHQLRKVAYLQPQLPIGALIRSIPLEYSRLAQEIGAFSVHPHLSCVTPEFIDDAHSRGLKVYVYTVDELEDIERLRLLGVDGVFTNYPERVLGYDGSDDLDFSVETLSVN